MPLPINVARHSVGGNPVQRVKLRPLGGGIADQMVTGNARQVHCITEECQVPIFKQVGESSIGMAMLVRGEIQQPNAYSGRVSNQFAEKA